MALCALAFDEQTLVLIVAITGILAIAFRGLVLQGMSHLLRATLTIGAIVLCIGIGFALWRQSDGGPPVKETLVQGLELISSTVRGTLEALRAALWEG